MINIIDKKSFSIDSIENWKISEYYTTHYVYTGILPDSESEEIPKDVVLSGEKIDISGVNGKIYPVTECTEIVYMSEEEKAAYYAAIEEKKRVASFQGRKHKVSCISYDSVFEHLQALVTKINSKRDIIPQQLGEIDKITGDQSFTILLNIITDNDMAAINQYNSIPDIAQIKIEENPNYVEG